MNAFVRAGLIISLLFKMIIPFSMGYHQLAWLKSIILPAQFGLGIVFAVVLFKDGLVPLVLAVIVSLIGFAAKGIEGFIDIFTFIIFLLGLKTFSFKSKLTSRLFVLIPVILTTYVLFILVSPLDLLSLKIPSLNYIASVLFALYVYNSKIHTSNLLSVALLLLLVILRSRSSLIAIIAFELFQNWKRVIISLLLILLILLIFFDLKDADLLINKWQTTSTMGNIVGRKEVWSYYILTICTDIKSFLLPRALTDLFFNNSSLGIINGRHYAAHNFWIQFVVDYGLILLVATLLLSLKNSVANSRKIFISIFLFSFFEPSLTFTANFVSIILFHLYFKYEFVNYHYKLQ